MKKPCNVRSLVSLSLLISLILPFTACDKEPVDERPELPPLESLSMDFSDFEAEPGGTKGTAVTYGNFTHSYLSVLFWNVTSTVTMTLPVAAYGHALQQEAVYVGDHSWEWSFDFKFESKDYTATLSGARINNEEFSMEMVIALAAMPAQGVKWFDGVVRYDHTHALWKLYKQGTVEVLEAEWNKNFETEAGDLKYTYVEAGHKENASYIMFQYMPEQVYDAAYTISLAAGTTEIEWNIASKEGRVKDPQKFGDSNWHCWDSLANGLADKECD
jgi:hypothetical protein